MRRKHLHALALALGCTQPLPPAIPPIARTAAPHAAPTPPVVPAPSAPSVREDRTRDLIFAGLRRHLAALGDGQHAATFTLRAGPLAVRESGRATPLAAALVETSIQEDDLGRCLSLVSVALDAPEVPARARELGCRDSRPDVVDVLVRDADGDGDDEIVLLSRSLLSTDDSARLRVAVFTVNTSLEPTWENLTLVEWRIEGSRDAASVDAALASQGRDEAPTEDTTPVRFVARLADATPAGFRTSLDARGLQVCEQLPRTRARCRTIAPSRLDDAQVIALQRRYFALGRQSGTDAPGFFFDLCPPTPQTTTCRADEYTGNVSLSWTITGIGPSMRLARVQYNFAGE